MSADMKAATERAQQMVATPRMFKADNLNLAAAFLEAESELKQERKAREEAEGALKLKTAELDGQCHINEALLDSAKQVAGERIGDDAYIQGLQERLNVAESIARVCREDVEISAHRAKAAEQRSTELQGDNEELTKDLAWHKQYAMRWEQAASVAMKQAADLQARLDRVEADVMAFLETEYPMTRRPLQAAIRKVIRALSAQPNAAAGQERREGHSALRGRPLDENGGAELEVFDPHPAPSAAPDAALPGLELAAKICESCALQIGEKYYPTMSKRCAEAIRAEIERRRA